MRTIVLFVVAIAACSVAVAEDAVPHTAVTGTETTSVELKRIRTQSVVMASKAVEIAGGIPSGWGKEIALRGPAVAVDAGVAHLSDNLSVRLPAGCDVGDGVDRIWKGRPAPNPDGSVILENAEVLDPAPYDRLDFEAKVAAYERAAKRRDEEAEARKKAAENAVKSSVEVQKLSIEKRKGDPRLTGEIKNNTPGVLSANILIALFDASGVQIGTQSVGASNIAPFSSYRIDSGLMSREAKTTRVLKVDTK